MPKHYLFLGLTSFFFKKNSGLKSLIDKISKVKNWVLNLPRTHLLQCRNLTSLRTRRVFFQRDSERVTEAVSFHAYESTLKQGIFKVTFGHSLARVLINHGSMNKTEKR